MQNCMVMGSQVDRAETTKYTHVKTIILTSQMVEQILMLIPLPPMETFNFQEFESILL